MIASMIIRAPMGSPTWLISRSREERAALWPLVTALDIAPSKRCFEDARGFDFLSNEGARVSPPWTVNFGVDFLGPCIAPDGKDSAVSSGQAHGYNLVGGQLPAQDLPRGVDALVKKSALNTDQ